MAKVMQLLAVILATSIAVGPQIMRGEQSKSALKAEHFDHDPDWEGHNDHIAPKVIKNVDQGFGYSATNFAGKKKGEIGGKIWRASTPASYADKITAKTLNDKLSASGTFALTASSGSSGAFIGWFKSNQPEGGRQNTLGLRFSGQGSGARLTLQLVTSKNQACGTKVTPWIVDKTKEIGKGRKFRPTSIKNDGTRYHWAIDYDPQANDGKGQFRCTVRSNTQKPEEFETITHTVNLPQGYKEQGATFDRFGLMNSMRPGNSLTIYFDDLQYDGKTEDFSDDPGWVGSNNQASYRSPETGGAHDFGFSPDTRNAGGSAGELGGVIWRSGVYGYYADSVGPLSLNDRLEASGKVVLTVGPPDSGMYIGWFNSAEKEESPTHSGSFLGIKIGGPTRVGHYFLPAYATANPVIPQPAIARKHPPNISVERGSGPVLVPKKVFDWKLIYNPTANKGNGAIDVALGNESVTLPLKPGDKAKGATFDRFGLFTSHIGGSYVRIYFDDLKYTARSNP